MDPRPPYPQQFPFPNAGTYARPGQPFLNRFIPIVRNSQSGTTTAAITLASMPQPGDMIVVVTQSDTSSTNPTVTGAGATWTRAALANGTSNAQGHTAIFVGKVGTAQPTTAITATYVGSGAAGAALFRGGWKSRIVGAGSAAQTTSVPPADITLTVRRDTLTIINAGERGVGTQIIQPTPARGQMSILQASLATANRAVFIRNTQYGTITYSAGHTVSSNFFTVAVLE